MFHLLTEVFVASNSSPKHYGVRSLMCDIDPIQDADEEQILREHLRKRGVVRMRCYIHRGDDLKRARPIEFDFFRDYRESPLNEHLQDQITLEECESTQPPRHPREELLKANCTLQRTYL